ncbi:hypothetical protein [Ureibacillus thermophilus]|uniref:Uncharacterized protein n=1 Tax=Ureibacillus thermophilus TaxID=367743 RepID=A0A4P6UWH1_9BACL|nr:hypothetical protein [Ureibacillus thermophilus]QBK26915.1 hypothetical protein DKZ56_14360 [Ureibacillus thermophilus]
MKRLLKGILISSVTLFLLIAYSNDSTPPKKDKTTSNAVSKEITTQKQEVSHPSHIYTNGVYGKLKMALTFFW